MSLNVSLPDEVIRLLEKYRGDATRAEFAAQVLQRALETRERVGLEGEELFAQLERAGWSPGELESLRIGEELRRDELHGLNEALHASA